MRYLVLSDIHSNWEALDAVLAKSEGAYDEIVCCGDLVGYGADPNAVVDWARSEVKLIVRGNHDKVCAGLEDDLDWFNPVAKAAALWTRDVLTTANLDYLRSLPKGPIDAEPFQLAHGSPLDEDEYLVSASEAQLLFPYLDNPLTFFGHSHLQGGFAWSRLRVEAIDKVRRDTEKRFLDLKPDTAYLVNPGSVGQPRDRDPRAAYILYDPDDGYLSYHRVSYDVESTQEKIRKAGLPAMLAERLKVGQ